MIASRKMPNGFPCGCRHDSKGSFTLSLRPRECALLEGLLTDIRRSFRLEDRGMGWGGESFSLKVRPYEYVLLEGLLREARQSFSLRNNGWESGESFSLKVRPHEYALLEDLLRDAGRSFVLDGPGLDSDKSFTLTVGPYDYQLLPRQAVVTFALFLPLYLGAAHFDRGRNMYVSRPERGIREFTHYNSYGKAVENGAPADPFSFPPRRGWGEFRKPGRAGPASYAQVFFLPAPTNRKEIFRAVPCCCGLLVSLRQSPWVDLHMLRRYLL